MTNSYFVVRWKKASGWYEQEFNDYDEAMKHFQFELENFVVEECQLIERTDDIIVQEFTGGKNGK